MSGALRSYMDLSQLEVFLAVAREGRFSRAAEKLHRTQSAVSQSIRKLEDEIGEPLFDRSSRDGLLTDAGHVLQEYAERLLNLRNDAQEALVELRELHKGKLAIAANEFTALYLLPVLAEFRRLHPMIKVTVQRALGSHIPDDVLRHNSELGVLTSDPRIAATPQTAAGVQKVSESLPCCAGVFKGGRSNRVRAAGKIPFSARALSVRVSKTATTTKGRKVHEEILTLSEC